MIALMKKISSNSLMLSCALTRMKAFVNNKGFHVIDAGTVKRDVERLTKMSLK